MYAVWDPALVAAGFRNKDLSLNPFMVSMIKPLMLANDETYAMVSDPSQELTNTFMASIAPTLLGNHLRSLSTAALGLLEKHFNSMGRVTDEPNLWLWVRGMMMSITSKSLYGEGDPFEEDPTLEQSLW